MLYRILFLTMTFAWLGILLGIIIHSQIKYGKYQKIKDTLRFANRK